MTQREIIMPGPKVIKKKSMLNSTEHQLYHAFGGILTFISMINTTSESLTARKFTIFQHFTFYERLTFHAQLT